MRTATAPQSIYVKAPCAENYDAMTPASGGKMCGTCQHLVTDFTEWKQEDIVAHLKQQTGKICGRFTTEQWVAKQPRWKTALKVSVLAALALWFSKADLKAQKQTDAVPATTTVSDSVVLLVRGQIKSDAGKKVYLSTIEALDSAGNVIATARSYDGKFELHVPVAYPKQAFTIVVRARGYRDEKISDYVSSPGKVVGIEMHRKLFGKPSRGYIVTGCPSF